MMQSGLTNRFRIAASKSNLFKKTCSPTSSHPKTTRNIALSVAHLQDATLTSHQRIGEPSSSRHDTAKSFRYKALCDSLTNEDVNPYRVWGNYFEFCSQYGPEQLSYEIHSATLRRCVPPAKIVRADAIQKLQEGVELPMPHRWEYRFQTIVRWIYMSGGTPTLEDFHFILEQFAVTGHFHGSKSILQELKRLKISPSYKTYGLCLQCAAHRLKLPCEESKRALLVSEASQMCMEILESMSKDKVPCTSVNLDLCIRILKESVDVPAFEKLLQIGYGIDLSYPDQPLLKTAQPSDKDADSQAITWLPFSTAALNTTIDVFGKRKLLSRMVAAFEVLTKPLDTYYGSPSRDFDDDDDWAAYNEENKAIPPRAEPNTTSYNFMIKHCTQAGSFVLARHYILEAFDIDQEQTNKLRDDLKNKPLDLVQAPKLTVTRAILLPIFGLANRTKHLPLADWVVRLCDEALSRKAEAISYFSELHKRDVVTEIDDSPVEEVAIASGPRSSILRTEPLDLDLNSLQPEASRRRPFDVELHISILEKDLQELQMLAESAKEARERLSSRIKERLRRRIWNQKDIYLVSAGRRVVLQRNSWRSITIPPPEETPAPKRHNYAPRTISGRNPVNPYFTPSFGRTLSSS